MNRSPFLSLCLLGLCLSTIGASAATPDAIQREITQANDTLQTATLRHDEATVRKLITDDYVIYFGNGSSERHDALLADIADPSVVWQKDDTEGLEVRHYNGDTAIATAAIHQRYAYVSAHASKAQNTPGYPKAM